MIIWAFIVMLILSSIKIEGEEIHYKGYNKIWLILAIIGVYLLIQTGLFTGWTEYGSMIVNGVQGRYFLPVLPVILLLLRTDYLVIKRNIGKEIMISTYLLQMITIVELFRVVINK